MPIPEKHQKLMNAVKAAIESIDAVIEEEYPTKELRPINRPMCAVIVGMEGERERFVLPATTGPESIPQNLIIMYLTSMIAEQQTRNGIHHAEVHYMDDLRKERERAGRN